MRDFTTLKVWKKAHELTLRVYRVSRDFPAEERFGLTAQLRSSAASIAANIAEGAGRSSEKEFANFLNIASGSASETECHILLAKDLGLISETEHATLTAMVQETRKMLAAFMRSLTADR
jgi:four helix bundle protein